MISLSHKKFLFWKFWWRHCMWFVVWASLPIKNSGHTYKLEIARKTFLNTFFLENTCSCVLGPWPRAFLSLASRGSVLEKAVLGLGFFLCPWPWPRALCPQLHLWKWALKFAPKISSLSIIPPPYVQNYQKIDKLLKSSPNGQSGSAPLITVSVMHQDCITALKNHHKKQHQTAKTVL